MLFKLFFYIIGICFMSTSFMYLILYLNLFSFGYSFYDYFKYLVGRFEFYYFFIGLFLIIFTVYRRD